MKLYIRVETLNSQKTTEVSLHDLGLGNGFLDTILKAQSMKEKVDKLDCIKLKFLSIKVHHQESEKKKPTQRMKKILQIIYLTTDLYHEYIKNLTKRQHK